MGDQFPDLGQARSTADYRLDEQRLFRDHLAPLEGTRIFKTDLWDEVKNTRILRWAADQGSRCYGSTSRYRSCARPTRVSRDRDLRAPIADIRQLPFRDGSFDAIYSMGTVEHFDETEQAIGEIFRVLRPGGRAVIGVPNRWDPFLRPLMVAIMYRVGLYGYGFEKSYSRRGLRENAGEGWIRGRGRGRHSLHPGLATDSRSGLPHLVATGESSHRCPVGLLWQARETVSAAPSPRLPDRLGGNRPDS